MIAGTRRGGAIDRLYLAADRDGAGMARNRLYLVLLLLWVSFTFFLTSLPKAEMPVQFRFADKVAHLAIYSVMGVLCGLWRRSSGGSGRRAVLEALLFIAAAGAVDEIHQYWIPGRSTEMGDWIADLLGGGAGGAFSIVLPRFFPFLRTE